MEQVTVETLNSLQVADSKLPLLMLVLAILFFIRKYAIAALKNKGKYDGFRGQFRHIRDGVNKYIRKNPEGEATVNPGEELK